MTWSPGFNVVTPAPDLFDDAAALVAEHGREEPGRVAPAHRVGVGVADAGGDESHQALARLRTVEIDLFDHQRPLRLPTHSSSDLHAVVDYTGARRDASVCVHARLVLCRGSNASFGYGAKATEPQACRASGSEARSDASARCG